MVHRPASSFPDFTGKSLDDGRYLVVAPLGLGSYGSVYRAIDIASHDDHKTVAIKCMAKPEPGSPEEASQTQEFVLHKKVSHHPNVITFHRHFSNDEFVFVVLDFCEGGDLFRAVEQQDRFFGNNQLAKATILQLIDALQHCHQQKVFHRDLKLENILFDRNGHLYLADFGLCTNSPMSVDFGCGTDFYMSPECLAMETGFRRFSTAHADLWAVGVLLTSIISGRNPWTMALTSDKCFNAFKNDNDFLFKTLAISAGANNIICGLFASNPLERTPLSILREQITDKEIALMQPYIPADHQPIILESFTGSSTSSYGILISMSPLYGESQSSDKSLSTTDLFLSTDSSSSTLPIQAHPSILGCLSPDLKCTLNLPIPKRTSFFKRAVRSLKNISGRGSF
ncbi:kinase-like protein [Mycena floridula]|nr:kinase-like protein [Mycena floridula]